MTTHTHYIYEVVMTNEQRKDDVPSSFADDNGGLERFETCAITHTHDFVDEPDEAPHTHMSDPLRTGTYIEEDQTPHS